MVRLCVQFGEDLIVWRSASPRGSLGFLSFKTRTRNFSGSATAPWAYSLTTVSDHYQASLIKTDSCIFYVLDYVCCAYTCNAVVLAQLYAPYVCTWWYLTLLNVA